MIPQTNPNPNTSESKEQAMHKNPMKIARKRHNKTHELQERDRHNHESFHTLGGQILYKLVKKM
jgi:hypothetical protein